MPTGNAIYNTQHKLGFDGERIRLHEIASDIYGLGGWDKTLNKKQLKEHDIDVVFFKDIEGIEYA